MSTKHIDEVRKKVIIELRSILGEFSTSRIALIHDLYGRFKLVVWPGKEKENTLISEIKDKLVDFKNLVDLDSMWISNKMVSKLDKQVYDGIWHEGVPDDFEERLRLVGRYRSHGGWVTPLMPPAWKKPVKQNQEYPPVITFYSFKGGVGRTTALAAFAVLRARAGERVVVIDADLDAPGIGSLLAADENGTTAPWGVLDYILEKNLGNVVFNNDYYHTCIRENVTGKGEIFVVPASRIDSDYTWKLARADIESFSTNPGEHIFYKLLDDVRNKLKPHWILIDVRAGLAVPAGILVGGFAHLNVIFGTSSAQSWEGLKLIIERLGIRTSEGKFNQSDLILVQSMVPRTHDLGKKSSEEFTEKAEELFSEFYYSQIPDDTLWCLEDIESSDAPHNPVFISYDEVFTTFRQIDDIVERIIDSKDYKELMLRILKNFEEEEVNRE